MGLQSPLLRHTRKKESRLEKKKKATTKTSLSSTWTWAGHLITDLGTQIRQIGKWVGWGFEQPCLAEGVPAHGNGVATRWSWRSLLAQTIPWFYDLFVPLKIMLSGRVYTANPRINCSKHGSLSLPTFLSPVFTLLQKVDSCLQEHSCLCIEQSSTLPFHCWWKRWVGAMAQINQDNR